MELTRKELAVYSRTMYKTIKSRGRIVLIPAKMYAIACIKLQNFF